jgi:hypothetical protein
VLPLSRSIIGNKDAYYSPLLEQPYSRITNMTERCGVSRPTRTDWLDGIVAAGRLRDPRAGRDRLFVNTTLLDGPVRGEDVPSGTR